MGIYIKKRGPEAPSCLYKRVMRLDLCAAGGEDLPPAALFYCETYDAYDDMQEYQYTLYPVHTILLTQLVDDEIHGQMQYHDRVEQYDTKTLERYCDHKPV